MSQVYGLKTNSTGEFVNKSRNDNAICGMILRGAIVGPTWTAPRKYNSIKELENDGFDQDYDATEHVMIWNHATDFFVQNPGGELWLFLTDKDDSLVEMATKLRDFQIGTGKRCRVIGIGGLHGSSPSPIGTVVNGVDSDINDAIAEAQTKAMECVMLNMGFHVVIEAADVEPNVNILDLRTLESGKVTCFCGQDFNLTINNGGTVSSKTHASIGLFIGKIASIPLHESAGAPMFGDIRKGFPANSDRFKRIGFSDRSDIEAPINYDLWKTMDDRGWVFILRRDDGKFYFNDQHTCTTVEDNLANIYYSRLDDALRRQIAIKGMFYIQRTTELDVNGKIPQIIREDWENDFIKFIVEGGRLGGTSYAGVGAHFSQISIVIDPDSDLLNPPKEMIINYRVVPKGQIQELKGTLTLTNSI